MSRIPENCPQLFGTREPEQGGCDAGVSLALGVCLQCPRGRKPDPIQNEVEYAAALEEIDRLFGATKGPELARLEALIPHVEAYEDKHYPMGEGTDARK